MNCYYFNSFANICKKKNYKMNSNSDRFTDDMDMDKFEQLRIDYWKMNRDTRIDSFDDYMWAALETMEWFGLYLCDEGGSRRGPELHQIVMEFCEENQRAENNSVPQNDDDDDPPTTPTCLGCVEDQPNQLAHMGNGGCLHIDDEFDLTDDELDLTDDDLAEVGRRLNFDAEEFYIIQQEPVPVPAPVPAPETPPPRSGQTPAAAAAAPDVLVVSLDRGTRWNCYAGNYIKIDRIVRGAPLFVKTNARGEKFFLFRGWTGHWLFGNEEQDIEMSTASISSTTTTTSLPCETDLQYEVATDTDAINDDDGWIVDESILVRAGQT
jgi:hypothetical protein